MKQNIIFDFGNVLGCFSTDCLTAPYVDTEEERIQIRDVVFDRLYWDQLDRGMITDEEVIDGVCSRIPETLHRKAATVYQNWINSMTPVPLMTSLVHELKAKGHKLYLLSNISIGFAEMYHTVPWIRSLFEQFDGLVFSGTVHMAKPDIEIFEYLLNQFQLKAEDCVFIDDNYDNVSGAKQVGIEGYFFDQDVKKLRDFLELQ